ncbi:Tas retrotransposon peptidase A16 [Ostertagia ostertagi]
MPMNADRVWRRLILSKFTENICSQVIKKENEGGTGFEVKNILDAVDEIITLQETTELTTKTLFGTQTTQAMQNNARGHDNGRHQSKQSPSHRMRHACLCGEAHSPHQCARFPTPEARRMEAKRQGMCWKCFDKTHGSRSCTAMGPCPKCTEDHHSSLCITSRFGLEPMSLSNRRQDPPQSSAQHETARAPFSPPTNRYRQLEQRNNNHARQADRVQALHAALIEGMTSQSKQPTTTQCVLQTASLLIFNEAEMEYQPINVLLDSGAQKSFLKAKIKNQLQLPTRSSTKFTTIGMGELQETFDSQEVSITLKSLHSSRKLIRQVVHSKPKLTAPTWTAQLSHSDKRFINERNFSIAQCSLESSEITPDLIIGQDLLNQVLCCDTPAMILPSGLILTPTIFGYTISGSSKVTSAKIKDDFVRSTHFNVVPISTATEGQERNITRKVDPRRKHMPSRTSRRKHRQQATQTSDSRKQDCMKLDSSSKSSARALLLLPYRTGRDENNYSHNFGKEYFDCDNRSQRSKPRIKWTSYHVYTLRAASEEQLQSLEPFSSLLL